MATEIKNPAHFLTAKQPVVLEVNRDTAETADIRVNRYVKQMGGSQLYVNVSDYCKVQLAARPLALGDDPAQAGEKAVQTGAEAASANNGAGRAGQDPAQAGDEAVQTGGSPVQAFEGTDIGRLAEASVTVDGVTSGNVYVVDSSVSPLPQRRFLTDLRTRPSIPGSSDELSAVWGEAEHPLYVALVDDPGQDPVASYVPVRGDGEVQYKSFGLKPAGDRKQYAILAVSPSEGVYERLDTVEFVPADNHRGVRLCWINKYGCLDYWNFESVEKVSSKTTKTRVYTSDGQTVTDVDVEYETTVRTKPRDARTMEALSQIVSSTGVWAVGYESGEGGESGESYEAIDVTSTSVTTYSSSSPSALELKYRPKQTRI